MAAYVIAHLNRVDFGPELAEYIASVDDTLVPFGGRFLVHGVRPIPLDGNWEGTVVVVEFDDLERARAWYDSPAYQAILPLRTRNSTGAAILVEGAGENYRAASLLARLGKR